MQLNNQSKPRMFDNCMQVVSYFRQNRSLIQLYQGLTVTVVRHLLYCPIFILLSSQLSSNLRIF